MIGEHNTSLYHLVYIGESASSAIVHNKPIQKPSFPLPVYCSLLDNTLMETTQKKGFFKAKLAKSFSRLLTTKPSSGSRKVVPCSAPTVSNTDRNMAKANYSTIPMVSSRQPTGFQQQKAVSYFKSPSFYDHNGYANQAWGRGDENVDSMATAYISNVRQRFKLDGVNN